METEIWHFTIRDFDNCISSPCVFGNCSDDGHSFNCKCLEGFTGVKCDININDCDGNICMNNASCIDGVQSYTCSCPDQFTGMYCENQIAHGQWSEWGNMSECSTSCGKCQMSRKRFCNNPHPDNGGDDCIGSGTDTQSCNNTQCPVCARISAPINGTMDCQEVADDINCTIVCNDGFDFDIEPMPVYFCGPHTYHEWNFNTIKNPELRLPKCTAIQQPEKLLIHYAATYLNLRCTTSDIPIATKPIIQTKVRQILTAIGCTDNKDCTLEDIEVSNCDENSRQRRSTETAGFTMTMSSRPDKGSGNNSLISLQEAFKQIHNAAESGDFTVKVMDDNYELDENSTSVVGDAHCRVGQTRVSYYCLPCGQGSYNKDDYCKPCELGTYQDTEGQTNCLSCPSGRSTLGHGSISIDDCTVNVIVDEATGVKVTSFLLGSSTAVIVVLLAFFGYRRYRIRLHKKIEVTDINNIQRPSSAQSTDMLGPAKPKLTDVEQFIVAVKRTLPPTSCKSYTSNSHEFRLVHQSHWK